MNFNKLWFLWQPTYTGLAQYLKMLLLVTTICVQNFILVPKSAEFT